MSRTQVQTYFDELADWSTAQLHADEELLIGFEGEATDFVRFNHGDIRQAGSVEQATLNLDLIEGAKHTEGSVVLAREWSMDQARVSAMLDQLRDQRRLVPEDPYLLYNTEPANSETVVENALPPPEDALADIRQATGSADMVGIYAAGDTFTGFANSLGQRNWHQAASFNLDWSFYLRADKAAKNLYAGFEWDDDAFESKVAWSRQQIEALDREPLELDPGDYRTYLAPAAFLELMDLWAWGGFSEKSHQTKQTPLLRMVTEDATIDESVRVSEDTAGGVAPNFQEAGFARPDEVVLIDAGAYASTLVSPRSAMEFGVDANGASAWEAPESMSVAAGSLPHGDALGELGTGLYVGNLWYTNFSDRAACRTTGMTRFATFWAEDGEVVAPVNVMRFDDTIYSLLGEHLVALTDKAEVILDPATYERRSTRSFLLPGVLVEEVRFTL
ncbi:MAG: metallopeptidase TldD-related protein [Acidimicrobiales bacterium]